MKIPPNRQASVWTPPFDQEELTAYQPARLSRSPPPRPRAEPAEVCPERDGKGHHWRVAAPAGPEVLGRCKACGMERTFSTTSEDSTWKSGQD